MLKRLCNGTGIFCVPCFCYKNTMKIILSKISKIYHYRHLFKELDFEFQPNSSTAIIGGNGTGKSSLMSIIAGRTSPSQGKISYLLGKKSIDIEDIYKHISWMAPSIEPYPYLTLKESFELHFRFKKNLLPSIKDCLEVLKFENSTHNRKLSHLSSGMLQRAKVGLALFSKSEILLLDEPTSFMDNTYTSHTLKLIEQFSQNRTYIIASNIENEIERIENQLRIN